MSFNIKYRTGFIFNRCSNVINSCNNEPQLNMARCYCDLLLNKYTDPDPDEYMFNLWELYTVIDKLIGTKRVTLVGNKYDYKS